LPVRRLRKTGLVAVLAALAACGRCGGAAGPSPERYVPANAVAAILVPEIRSAAGSLAEFYSTASDFPGTSELPALRASLSAQLGFDPFRIGSLREAGIDPRGGLAVAFLSPPGGAPPGGRLTALLVLPVSNRAAADALVRRIAGERLGASERSVESIGAVQVAVYRQNAGSPPALSVGDGEGCFVLSAGPSGPAAVARALSLRLEDSVSASSAWKVALGAAGEDPAVIAFVPPGSPVLEGLWPVSDGAALSLSAEPGKLRARAVLLLGEREPSFLALTTDGGDRSPTAKLDPASTLVGRWDVDPAAFGQKAVPMVPGSARAWLALAGIELQRDLFDPLAPGGAASLSLAPRIDLTRLDAGSLRRDPLRLAQFEVILPVRDPARLVALSERIVRLAGRRSRGGEPYTVPTASGEVAWVIDGEWLVAAGGAKGRLPTLRARMGGEVGGYRAPTDTARRLLATGGLGALVVDTQNFAASVRALPPEAFGTGPTGFVMRSLAERIVEPAARIEAASVRAELVPGALVMTLVLEPRPAEGAP
jgi:hypothetical protein